MDDATKKGLKANQRVVPENEFEKANARIREKPWACERIQHALVLWHPRHGQNSLLLALGLGYCAPRNLGWSSADLL